GWPGRGGAPGRAAPPVSLPPFAIAPAPTAAVATWPLLLALARRRVLRALDQLFGLDERPVLVLGDQLQADASALLVDLLHLDVDDVAAGHDVLDVADAARADVGDVQQPVGALRQLDEGAELRRLDDLAGVLVAALGLLGQPLDRVDRGVGLVALCGIDEDVAVLLDVDLDVVIGLERTDRLAALPDHHSDLLGVDLDRGDARRVARKLLPRRWDRLEHLVEDELTRPSRLLESVSEDLLRDAADLDFP